MNNLEQKIKRQEQVNQGLFDGRYKQRVVSDKKKQEAKSKARKKINPKDFQN